MRWLDDKDSVSQGELEKNKREARAAANWAAAYWAAANWAGDAAYWVDKYFDKTGEDRAQYEKELEK